MVKRYTNPVPQYLDTGGESIAGARVYFYAAGTSTPLDTYTDETLVTPNSNPVVCDGDGRLPAVFLSPTEYKVVLKEAVEDVTIWERDPVDGDVGGANGPGEDLDTYAELKALAVGFLIEGATYYVNGRTASGDGGGGHFKATQTSPGADNDGTILDSDTAGWYFERQFIINYHVKWFGALGDDSNDDGPKINATVAAVPSTGGTVNIDAGTYRTSVPILDSGKRIHFATSAGTIIKPTVDVDVVRLTGQFSSFGDGTINGGLVATGSGNGLIVGYGGANTTGVRLGQLVIEDMRGDGLVWEHGSFLNTEYVICRNNDGNGTTLTNNYDNNNHGDLLIHNTSNGGWGFEIESTATTALQSRSHTFRNIQAFGNGGGGILINSSENAGHVYCEVNTGSGLEFGALSKSNNIIIVGDLNTFGATVDSGSENRYTGRDGNNSVSTSIMQGNVLKARNESYIGGMELRSVANYTFELAATNTNNDVNLDLIHDGTGDLILGLPPFTISGETAGIRSMLTGGGTLNFGTVGANTTVERTITVTGAADNMVVHGSPRTSATPATGIMWSYRISAADTVAVRAGNLTGAGIAVTQAFRVMVIDPIV